MPVAAISSSLARVNVNRWQSLEVLRRRARNRSERKVASPSQTKAFRSARGTTHRFRLTAMSRYGGARRRRRPRAREDVPRWPQIRLAAASQPLLGP